MTACRRVDGRQLAVGVDKLASGAPHGVPHGVASDAGACAGGGNRHTRTHARAAGLGQHNSHTTHAHQACTSLYQTQLADVRATTQCRQRCRAVQTLRHSQSMRPTKTLHRHSVLHAWVCGRNALLAELLTTRSCMFVRACPAMQAPSCGQPASVLSRGLTWTPLRQPTPTMLAAWRRRVLVPVPGPRLALKLVCGCCEDCARSCLIARLLLDVTARAFGQRRRFRTDTAAWARHTRCTPNWSRLQQHHSRNASLALQCAVNGPRAGITARPHPGTTHGHQPLLSARAVHAAVHLRNAAALPARRPLLRRRLRCCL